MDRNHVRLIPVSINTKFLNCLQPEWSKYVTMVRHNQTGDTVSYDVLYDSLVQFEPHVLASKAKKAAKNHDPLALIAHSNASSSQSHANSSYSPQPYYVTHPSSVVDYEDEYQGELQEDSQEDKLTTAMINQAVIQDGRVDTQTKNEGYSGNGNKNAGRQDRNQTFNAGTENDESNQIVQRVPQTESAPRKENVQCYNCNEKGHYAHDFQKLRVHDAKKKPNTVYEPFLKAGLGYKNPERLKKAIAAQPKMYDGEMLYSAKLKIDSPDSEETLEDAEEIP
ncbi:retrovirus-related pol polyprotein from transposon TNT 1-94 [Tanacetum coccineum]|uniref:Retrovirus-related pol polyprotein from transposon TNT 1-94 n=1 Tax=Tanacetum coccineum TaxID=301880 RepID=A0ABQ5EG78_9ASTR